jgi:DNA processing protein
MNNKETLLHLSLIDDVGSAAIAMMLRNKPEFIQFADMYDMHEQDLRATFHLTLLQAQNIKKGLADTTLLEQELELIEKHNAQWITSACDEYPTLLKNIHLLPPILYWRGSLINNEKAIAFVGARKANQYCQYAVNELVPGMVHAGYVIVSGGAMGADAMAHQAALDAGGTTIVVLGAGLLQPVLQVNRKLFAHILERGSMIASPFPLRTQANEFTFPARNRIISGLSKGTVVLQAAQKSGALITAHYALEQGRDVFAVPGSIADDLSKGCHSLIAQGAKLATSAQDILIEFGEMVAPVPTIEKKSKKQKEDKPLSLFSATESQDNTQDSIDTHSGTPTEIILKACKRPTSTDDLAHKVSMDLASIQSLLFDLQLDGKIRQNFMGMWERK